MPACLMAAGICLLLAASSASAADSKPRLGKDFPGVEKLMTPEEYARAGLDKLTPEERAALDAWLVRYTAGQADVVRQTSNEVRQAARKQPTVVTARIKPPFSGWSGTTVFHLDNGQTWQQRMDGEYHYTGDDTRVEIKKNFFGFYVLKLVATGRSIGVKLVD